jgi:hypothetical protein
MTHELEQHLRDCIRYALQTAGYAKPRTRDTSVRDAYYVSVSETIVRQIKLSWTFESPDILRKNPPREPHSDRGHYPDKWAEFQSKNPRR